MVALSHMPPAARPRSTVPGTTDACSKTTHPWRLFKEIRFPRAVSIPYMRDKAARFSGRAVLLVRRKSAET